MIEISIQTNSWIARLAAAKLRTSSCAVTIGTCIYLYNASCDDLLANQAWYRHELAHVLQYQKFGMFGFLFRYTWYSIRYGYYHNPLELEARIAEENTQIAEGFFVKEKT